MGLLFAEEHRTINRVIGYYDLSFLIDVPDFQSIIENLAPPEILVNCSLMQSVTDICYAYEKTTSIETYQLIDLTNNIKSEVQQLQDLLGQFRVNTNKRALLNIAGPLQWLFGTAKAQDVKRLQNSMKQLADNMELQDNNVESLFKMLKENANMTNKRIDSLLHHVKQNDEILLSSIKDMKQLSKQIDFIYQYAAPQDIKILFSILDTIDRLQAMSEFLITYRNLINAFTLSLQTLASGRLPRSLVSPTTLGKAVNRLNEQLRPAKLVALKHTDFRQYYYDARSTSATMLKSTLVIHVQVPLIADRVYNFDAYSVQTLQIPVHGAQTNQNAFMKLKTDHEHLLVAKDMQTYGYATSAELQECRRTSYVCSVPQVTYSRQRDDCIWAAFNDETSESCEFVTHLSKAPSYAIKVDHHEYLLNNILQPVMVHCLNKRPEQQAISTHAIISLGCFCTIMTDDLVIGPRIEDCVHTQQEPVTSTQFPVNYELARRLRLQDKLKHPHTDFRSESPPTAPVIDLGKYKDLLDGEFQRDTQLGIENDKLFEKMAELPKLQLQKTAVIAPHRSVSYTDIYIIGGIVIWNVALTVALVFVYLKYSKSPILAMLGGAQQAQAFELAHTTKFTPIQEEEYLTDTAYCLAILILLAVAYYLSKMIRKLHIYRKSRTPSLYGEVVCLYYKMFTATSTAIVFVTDIPADQRMRFDNVPNATDVTVTKTVCLPKLNFQWNGKLTLNIGEDLVKIDLPESVHVSFINATRIANMQTSNSTIFGSLLIKKYGQNQYDTVRT